MATEIYTVLALPHSWRPAEDVGFNVSLFVAPRLTPDHTGSTLADFDLFQRWGDLLDPAREAVTIDLHDQHGELGIERVVGRCDPALWARMFPPETPVAGADVPAEWHDDHQWRSFDARAVSRLSSEAHLTTVAAHPVDRPAPSDHPLLATMFENRGGTFLVNPDSLDSEHIGHWAQGHGDLDTEFDWDESRITARFDDQFASYRPIDWQRRGQDGKIGILEQLHRLRRFYERPLSQQVYQREPDDGAPVLGLPSPLPEFHTRVTAAGDHGELLRALGLVVDLRVTDLKRLRAATQLRGRIRSDDHDRRCRSIGVLVSGLADGALVTVAAGEDWSDGLLRIGDQSSYTVLDHDVDGSGLKTERFAYTLPRLFRDELNGRETQAAPPAMRASGLTLVRTDQAVVTHGRVVDQLRIQDEIDGDALSDRLLGTEDVMRGIRVEVWDDTRKTWHGLHERLTTLAVDGAVVLDDERTTGFLQGTAATQSTNGQDPGVYVHEAVFGWEGWSLSAPRPHLRIRFAHDGTPGADSPGRESVEPTAPLDHEQPPHPFTVEHRVAPGTLPRLRYGRAYAFRAFGVDLAGNSRPLPELSRRLTLDPASQLRRLRSLLVDPAATPLAGLRDVAAQRAVTRGDGPTSPVARMAGRRQLIESASAAVVRDTSVPLLVDTRMRAPEELHDLVASAAADLSLVGGIGAVVRQVLETTTLLTPFLRWDPVGVPVVVPRRRYTEGESQRVLVVRSGVTQDPDTLVVKVDGPEVYAAQVEAAHPTLGFPACERHLVPPKVTQMTAELHGRFDPGIGVSSAAAKQRMLNWALLEDGSLQSPTRYDPDAPDVLVAQEGVSVVENDPNATGLATLPLAPGTGLPAGQYVIHDTPHVTTPYLPDPLAAGISIVFPEAGGDLGIAAPYATEGFTTRYPGTWPKVEPIRLDLVGRKVLEAHRDHRVLTIGLPAGDLERLRLSSSMRAEDLDLMAVWRHLAPELREDPAFVEAAKDGWMWGLTPYDDLLLVHAVPRPVQAPRIFLRGVSRVPGETVAALRAELQVHGGSTQHVTAQARWTDCLDLLSSHTAPSTADVSAIAFTVPIAEHESVVDLGRADTIEALEGVSLHELPAVHQFGDTKHRRVTYTLRATTRFREYFPPELLAPDPTVPGDDGRSVVSAPLEVSIPSSARPAAPVVHSVVPLFRWESGTEAEQPMGWRHERRTGVRIYLERPWFSSGEGELLGVLLARNGDDDFDENPTEQSGFPFVSKIGADPIWMRTPEVDDRALLDLQLASVTVREHWDDTVRPGRPLTVARNLTIPVGSASIAVDVAGYQPQFNAERGLWYVDVAIDPWAQAPGGFGSHLFGDHGGGDGKPTPGQEAVWPFLRLAVARFQPASVSHCELSAPVRCHYVQLPPVRTTTVDRTDERSVRVVVSGAVGELGESLGRHQPTDPHRRLIATLSRRDPTIPTDLGWIPVANTDLLRRGTVDYWNLAWVGELTAPSDIVLRRPSPGPHAPESDWKVTVQEWERFPGDPLIAQDLDGDPIWEQRLVYADEFLL